MHHFPKRKQWSGAYPICDQQGRLPCPSSVRQMSEMQTEVRLPFRQRHISRPALFRSVYSVMLIHATRSTERTSTGPRRRQILRQKPRPEPRLVPCGLLTTRVSKYGPHHQSHTWHTCPISPLPRSLTLYISLFVRESHARLLCRVDR